MIRYRQRTRHRPRAVFLFGVFGYLRESKRLMAVLEAFGVGRSNGRAALLVAGRVRFDRPGTRRRTAARRDRDRPPAASAGAGFWTAAAAVDACINLRYPAAGETSGIAIRLMGIGKPVMVTDAEECSRFPEDACIRIPPGSDGARIAAAAHGSVNIDD